MIHPLTVLREFFQANRAMGVGVVQSIAGTTAMVRTRGGINEYPLNGVSVAVGQRVRLSEAGVVGVITLPSTLPTYDV